MRTPENGQIVQDYERCGSLKDVERLLANLNCRGWSLICVTPYYNGTFLVFFRRPAV